MSQVQNKKPTCITSYRRYRRRRYWQENSARMQNFLERFLHCHFKVDLDQFKYLYMQVKSDKSDTSWDICQFREDLANAIGQVYGEQMWQELQNEFWFNHSGSATMTW